MQKLKHYVRVYGKTVIASLILFTLGGSASTCYHQNEQKKQEKKYTSCIKCCKHTWQCNDCGKEYKSWF